MTQLTRQTSGSKQRLTRVHFHDNYHSTDNPPQCVDTSCHLSDFTSTTDSLDESSTLSVRDDHLLQVDSTSPSLQLQETSSVEIEFVPELEGKVDNGNLSPNAVFLEYHDNELFLLNQEIHHLTIAAIRKTITVRNYT